ncbi:MAG: glycosyltransferase [Chlorobi bacterium]|nr:glycosyltransferase [Chlorobiota bacterium]
MTAKATSLSKERPRLVVDVERMKYPYTGLYYYSRHLAAHLMSHPHNFFNTAFVGAPGMEFPFPYPFHPKRVLTKHITLKEPPYDVLHGTWQLSKFLPAPGTKYILTIHDLNFLYQPKSDRKKKKLLRQIQSRIDWADAIVTISEYVKNDVLKHLNVGRKPVHVIYNGVELEEFPEFDSPRYRPSRPFLFTMGTVLYKKHFHVLPALLPVTPYELVIAGIRPDKKYEARIREEARRHGVEDRVVFTGPVTPEEKYWYLARSEAFLFPSISEGFGLPPVEAMRLGKPVFLSRHTSLPEIGGEYAYYFDSFEPEHMRKVLAEGLEDYRRRDRASEIKRHSMRFTWPKAVSQYLKVYEEVLHGSRTGKPRPKITAIIPTRNEEAHIRDAIRSVSWADEILVIDSHSTDRTVDIAREMGAKVIKRKFDNFSAQKNYAIARASHDWIFVLDADERVPEELRKEIFEVLDNPGGQIAFWIPRQNFIGDKKIRFSGWQNDKCIRLFNRRHAGYDGRFVHEEIRPRGKTGRLRTKLLHYPYRDESDFTHKLELYARLKAVEWHKKGKRYHPLKQWLTSAYRFFKHFILHLGFLDGKAGWKIALHSMRTVWRRYENLKELEQKAAQPD